MGVTLFIPNWFLGLDVIFECLFLIITAMIGYLSFKFYKLTKQNQNLHFAYAFFAIALSYLLKSGLNIAIYQRIHVGGEVYKVVRDVITLRQIGEFVQDAFMMSGLLIIIYLQAKNKDSHTFSLIAILTFILAVITQGTQSANYVVISVLLIYILCHCWRNYQSAPNRSKLYVLLGFAALTAGNILFCFVPLSYYFYITGHFAELIGYIMLAVNLALVFSGKIIDKHAQTVSTKIKPYISAKTKKGKKENDIKT